jgi:hypothetical protein
MIFVWAFGPQIKAIMSAKRQLGLHILGGAPDAAAGANNAE